MQEEYAVEEVPGYGGAADFGGATALEYGVPTDGFVVPVAADDSWGADAGVGVSGFEVAAAPEIVYTAPPAADFAAGY